MDSRIDVSPPSPVAADFELRFSPSVRLVSKVRRFVMGFYEEVLGDLGPEVAHKIALATHELLENVKKYSSAPSSRLAIEVRTEPSGAREVAIRTWNQATADQMAALREIFSGIDAAQDRQSWYRQLMLQPSKSADSGGLGLGRIMAEADMSVHCSFEENTVCIEARYLIGP
jgi:hypothetical protein